MKCLKGEGAILPAEKSKKSSFGNGIVKSTGYPFYTTSRKS